MKKTAFVLTECLVAAALACAVLPLLAQSFAGFLSASVELRRTQRAHLIAVSCLDRAGALYNTGSSGSFEESFVTSVGAFDAQITIDPGGTGGRASVNVRWESGAGMKNIRLSRHF